jgi:hypothetical protein
MYLDLRVRRDDGLLLRVAKLEAREVWTICPLVTSTDRLE